MSPEKTKEIRLTSAHLELFKQVVTPTVASVLNGNSVTPMDILLSVKRHGGNIDNIEQVRTELFRELSMILRDLFKFHRDPGNEGFLDNWAHQTAIKMMGNRGYTCKSLEADIAEELYNFGQCYETGIGVDKNEAEAVNWYRAAADQGHADASLTLARCYKFGIGVRKNIAKAAKWLHVATERGVPNAKLLLGYS